MTDIIENDKNNLTTEEDPGVESTLIIEQYLMGVEFPANKEQLLQYANQNNVPAGTLYTLEQLPDNIYYSLQDIREAVIGK